MTELDPAPPPAFCPYKGLRPYTADDRRYFFGRTSDSKILAGSALARRLTVFFGGSGVGKTSVLRAGAVPLIEETTGAPSVYFNTWQSEDFLDRLHAAIGTALPSASATSAPSLPQLAVAWSDNVVVAPARDEATVRRPAPLVLLLDQFEEFFLYLTGPRERFTQELAELVNRRDLDARVVLSLRDDRLALLERLASRIPDILTNRIELEPLDYRGAKAACEKPIEHYNRPGNPDRGELPQASIEPALVDLILTNVLLRETTVEGDVTPEELKQGRFDTAYLQLALTKIWAKERAGGSSELRAQTFKTLGGGRGIATGHLEEELGRLSADEVFLCGRFFDRLVTSTGSKIAQPVASLRDATGLPKEGEPAPQPSWRVRVMGFVTGAIVATKAGTSDPDGSGPLPVPWVDRRSAERFGRLASGAAPADMLNELLQRLAEAARFILRTVPSPSRDGGPAYEIFHDVLAEPIRAWTDRFRRSLKIIDDYWWNALSLGAATVFALLMIASVGFGIWAWRASAKAEQQAARAEQQAAQAKATLEWSRLEIRSDNLSVPELQSLHNIVRFSEVERDIFVNQLHGNEAHILKLAFHVGELSRALGLKYAISQAGKLLEPLLAAIPTATDSDQIPELAQAVEALGPTPAQAALVPVLAAIATADDVELRSRAQAVQALGPRLEPAQAQAALATVLAAIATTTDFYPLQALVKAVQALGPTPAQAQAALVPVLAAIATADGFELHSLAQAVQALGPRLEPAQAQAALATVLAAIATTTNSYPLQALVKAVQALGPTPAQAQAALVPVLAAISTADNLQLRSLAQAVQAFGPRLEPAQAQAALATVLAAIATTTDSFVLRSLAQAVQALGPTPAQAQAALAPVLAAISTADNLQLLSLAQAVHALGPTPAQAQAALVPALAAIATTTNSYQLLALAQAVQTLDSRLEPADRVRVAAIARSGLAFARDAASAGAWAGALGGMMPAAPAEAALAEIVELLKFPTAGLQGDREDGSDNPTRVLLTALATRFPDVPALKTGRLDDALNWIAKTYPRIDLDSPPQQPPPLRPDASDAG